FFDYLLKRLCATNDASSDKGRLAILRGMAEALHKTRNSVLLDTHAQKTALRLGVAVDAVRKEFSRIKPQPSIVREEDDGPDDSVLAGETEAPAQARPSNHELHLLKLLFIHEELVPWLVAHLDLDWLTHPLIRQIVNARLAAQEHETWHNLAGFLDSCESAEQRSLITEAVADERQMPNPEIQLADVTLKLRNQFLDQRIAALTQKISSPETADVEKIQLLQEQQALKLQKRSPLAALEK
ncbi:MAG TPA: DNA primase, partial [Candidatus Binatia bacterium]|nr:DNA primase [Candidatus Binatia bacterium]